jgi:hypothetical protein
MFKSRDKPELSALYILASSANNFILRSASASQMSFVCTRKSVGPKTLPNCGTPLVTKTLAETQSKMLTACVQIDKKALIHDNK